jgi:hypothetical protein
MRERFHGCIPFLIARCGNALDGAWWSVKTSD